MDTSAQRSDWRNGMRTVLLAAGCALLIASTAQVARASQDPAEVATAQAETCEAAGGEASVEVERTIDGVSFTSVSCKGGVLDGILCDNGYEGTWCRSLDARTDPDFGGHVAPLYDEVIAALETGSTHQINTAVAEFEAALASDQSDAPAAPGVVSPDDQDHDHDQDTTTGKKHKGKKGKHGKKGGKHRKR